MAIKIKKNGKIENFILHSTDVRVLDLDGKFKSKNLEDVLREVSDTEHVYIGEVDETKEGVWIDDEEILDNEEDNGVVKRLEEYVDKKVDVVNSQMNDITNEVNQLSNPNLLMNGDFQVWQRGTSFSLQNTTNYTADRWSYASVSSDEVEFLKSDNGFKIKLTNGSDKNTRFHQFIEKGKMFNGKTLTISFSAKSLDDFDRKLGILLSKSSHFSDIYYQNEINLTNENKIYKFTFSIPNNSLNENDVLSFSFGISAHIENYHGLKNIYDAPPGNGIEFNWIKLELGDKATPFYPRPYAQELAMCQRYYEEGFIWGNYMGLVPYQSFHCPFKVVKRIVPTVVYEDPNVSGTTVSVQTDASYQDGHNCIVSSSVGNSGTAYRFQVKYKADAEIY